MHAELEGKIQRYKSKEMSVQNYVEKQIVGMHEQCIERIKQYVSAGVTYFALKFPDFTEIESLKIFSKHVIPAFKSVA